MRDKLTKWRQYANKLDALIWVKLILLTVMITSDHFNNDNSKNYLKIPVFRRRWFPRTQRPTRSSTRCFSSKWKLPSSICHYSPNQWKKIVKEWKMTIWYFKLCLRKLVTTLKSSLVGFESRLNRLCTTYMTWLGTRCILLSIIT